MKYGDRRLLTHAAAARRYIGLAAGVAVATAALVVVQAFTIADLVARPFERGVEDSSTRGALVLLGAVVVGRAILAWTSEAFAHRAAAQVKSELRRRLLDHAVGLGPAWLSRQSAGEVATLATRGIDGLDGYFARYLPALVAAAVIPVSVVAVIFSQDVLAGSIILLTLPLIPVFAVLVGITTQRRTRRSWRTLSALGGHFLDVVAGLPTLLVFRRATAQVEMIRRVSEENRRATMATLRLAFLSSAVLEFVGTISVALVAVSTGLRLLGGSLDLRTGLVVLVLAPEAYWPLRQVGAQFHASADGLAAADQLFDILETPAVAERSARPRLRCDVSRSTIRVEALSVTYDRSRPALPVLDLTVAPGEHVGITGPSGCGKSTLLGVLLGFVSPSSGRVLVDGPHGSCDLTDLDPDLWLSQVSWVPQRPWLAAASITDNVRLARPGAGDAEVALALDLAHASGFVSALPRGAETVVGANGAGLSAGQRQRIALARAFLRGSGLVLLDEPTAHLDPASEAAVAAAVSRLAADRTVIAVAHRPALLAGADRIVQLGTAASWSPQLAAAEVAS